MRKIKPYIKAKIDLYGLQKEAENQLKKDFYKAENQLKKDFYKAKNSQ